MNRQEQTASLPNQNQFASEPIHEQTASVPVQGQTASKWPIQEQNACEPSQKRTVLVNPFNNTRLRIHRDSRLKQLYPVLNTEDAEETWFECSK